MARQSTLLQRLNASLPQDWEAKLEPEQGRIYYINHASQQSSWLPPTENWDPGSMGLPYGWECAVDKKNNKPYFINHLEKFTTQDDPRDDPDYVEPPKPREIELSRDPQKGFGFVAGSEKPVVVRFVTDGGPSVERLLPGDQIIKINGEDVKKAPREYVIDLVRSCKQSITLTVCQPYSDNSTKKSSLLTAAKKARLKNNPNRVRFAENVTVTMVNGAPLQSSTSESYVPFMPNVLKVFLENGQTKSFKYDNKTTVKDVVQSLQEKLNVRCVKHFNLVLQNTKNHTPGRMTFLQEQETLAEIASRPGARHFRCLFRVMFVPRDAYDLLKEDPVSFEYFYMQCCNDVVNERFTELKGEVVYKLAALQIQQHAMSNNNSGKVNLKAIEKDCGLEKFLPEAQFEGVKIKEIRKILTQQLKLNQSLTPPGQKHLSSLQAKLHYMKIVSELKTFGSRIFMVTLLDKKTEAMVLVGPKSGIGLITNIKQHSISMLADFDQILSIKVAKEKDNMQKIEITITSGDEEEATLNFGLLKDDAMNFVGMVEGYYKIFVDNERCIVEKPASKQSVDPDVPPFLGKHRVITSPWSYPDDVVSTVIQNATETQEISDNERIVNLCVGPPAYDGDDGKYIAKIKMDLGIKTENELIDNDNVTSLENLHPSEVNDENKPPVQKSVIVIGSPDNIKNGPLKHKDKGDFRSEISEPKKPRKVSLDTRNNEVMNTDGNVSEETGGSKTEELSDTDSGVESEKKVALEDPAIGSQDQESDDTDSWGTPSNSPAKDTESFGLHSPDKLPRTESDFEVIASSFGLLSPDKIPHEIQEGILDPRMFSERRLYLDPDIIDLTLMPPPSSQQFDDMESMATWHSPAHLTSSLPLNTASVEIESTIPPKLPSSQPPPFNRSASTSDNPDFFDSDIDELIAKLTIPPPPGDTDYDYASPGPLAQTWSGPDTASDLSSEIEEFQDIDQTVDDIFASLIIPPPPGEASEEIEALPIVPPVTTLPEEGKQVARHRRSSSVDLSVLKFSTELPKNTSSDNCYSNSNTTSKEQDNVSSDGSTVTKSTSAKVTSSGVPTPNNFDISISSLKHKNKTKSFDSPASVSEKLSSLLQSHSHHGNVDENGRIFRRTSSLRLSKTSSMDTVKSVEIESDTKSEKTKPFHTRAASVDNILDSGLSSQIPKKVNTVSSQESKLNSKYSRHLRRTNSFDLTQHNLVKDEPDKVVTESFSSIKSNLQNLKDFLLNKSNSTRKERNSEKTANQQSPLKRSNSFTLNFLKRRSSLSDSDEKSSGSDKETSKIKRKERKSSFRKEKEKSTKEEKEKKAPALLNTLATSRTFRPPSSISMQDRSPLDASSPCREERVGGKKSGPMKALSTVLTSSSSEGSLLDVIPPADKKSHSNGPIKIPITDQPIRSSETDKSEHKSSNTKQERSTKDDISLINADKSKKKEKENPFGTVNNMWRPISMSKSSSIRKDDAEEYRIYNNFDALRDISAGKAPPAVKDVKIPVMFKKSKSAPLPAEATTKIPKSPSSPPNVGMRKGSISGVSFAVIKDKIHESHSDSVKEILAKEYKEEGFQDATKDADRLLAELKQTMETLKDSRIDRQSVQFGMCKDELTNQVMQFVKDAKLLVSNATQTKQKMASNLNSSMHTLARIFLHSQATMIMMEATHQAQHLGFEVIKLTNAFKSTVNAAQAAVGKPLGDPHMKYLMRQATNLAQLISNLLKSLKTLEQK